MPASIHVDFNDFESDGRLTALAAHADGPVAVGDSVIARDADRNFCLAEVVARRDDVLFLELDWSTWNRVRTVIYAGLHELTAPDPFADQPTGLDPHGFPDTKVAVG
jgi:hypothetical protein